MTRMRIRTAAPLAALAAVTALALTGCVDNSTPASSSTASPAAGIKKDAALANQLPQKVKDAGK